MPDSRKAPPERDLDPGAYSYDLPESLIAQHPAERRDEARMLVLNRRTGTTVDRSFRDLPGYLRPEDVVVLNNTKVFAARLLGRRVPGGGGAELFLVRPRGGREWHALARPGRKLREGAQIMVGEDVAVEILGVEPDGMRRIRFCGSEDVGEIIARVGRMPLPPYIRREQPSADDRTRYQTVYAREEGAVAAPTAGLHFTPDMLDCIRGNGTSVVEITLHVGYGTFEPVRVDDLSAHRVAAERLEISEAAAASINRVADSGGRVVAVGTTSTRALESAVGEDGRLRAFSGETDLTITPGYTFRCVDVLLTNFHLPNTSLLVLVSTFAGRERVLTAYRHAVREKYRFYSYGDCMLIV